MGNDAKRLLEKRIIEQIEIEELRKKYINLLKAIEKLYLNNLITNNQTNKYFNKIKKDYINKRIELEKKHIKSRGN